MTRVSASIASVQVVIEHEDSLHPEIVETLLTRASIQAALLYSKMLEEASQYEGLQLEND